MEEQNNNTKLTVEKLLLKRKHLSDLRDKILQSQNNKKRKTVQKGTLDESPVNLDYLEANFKNQKNEYEDDEIEMDYNSDDSVKDKDYEPESSDDSYVSGSPDILDRRKAEVKKRIFSPEKLDVTNKPFLSESQADIEKKFDLITVEDLLGPQTKASRKEYVSYEDNFFDVQVSNVPNVTIDTFGDLSDSCDELITYNENIDSTITSKYGVMTADNQGRIFLPITFTNEPLNHNSCDLQLITSNNGRAISFSNDYCRVGFGTMIVEENGTIHLPFTINSLNNNHSNEIQASASPASKPKKRECNHFKWKRIASKIARLKGSPYRSTVAKTKQDVPARSVKSPCNCKSKCYEKITQEGRQEIFNQFWKKCQNWSQRRQFIVDAVKKVTKRVMKTDGNLESDRRKFSYKYTLTTGHTSTTVCKVMFLNTLSLGEKFVRVSLDKKLDGGMTAPDQRGRHVPANKSPEPIILSVMDHINSYPHYESHYSREKTNKKYLGSDLSIATMYRHYEEAMKEKGAPADHIAKQWLYRQIFNTKFNLSFKLPSVDTCDDCDAFQRKKMDAINETDRDKIEKEKEIHMKEAQERYDLKKKDKKDAEESPDIKKVVMFDLQKCLATPNLTNSKSFYLRKLWTLNLTLFDSTNNVASNMLWSENIAGRGGNEIASCIVRWAEENRAKIAVLQELTFWSDNCAGQNRNVMIIMAYFWLLHKFPNLNKINHKFMLKGHTHMEVDQIHAQIEKKKKGIKSMEIATPRDWSQFIKTCGGKRPFVVHDMTLENFKDFTSLYKKGGPYVIRKKTKDGQEFKISESVWLQLRNNEPGVLFFKKNFSDDFLEVPMMRNATKKIVFPDNLPQVRESQKPVSTAKYNDLMTLLKWIPDEFHLYYKNLPHDGNVPDFPPNDS